MLLTAKVFEIRIVTDKFEYFKGVISICINDGFFISCGFRLSSWNIHLT